LTKLKAAPGLVSAGIFTTGTTGAYSLHIDFDSSARLQAIPPHAGCTNSGHTLVKSLHTAASKAFKIGAFCLTLKLIGVKT
jgi:hypothetical protein